MGSHFDRERGPTGMEFTYLEKALIKTLNEISKPQKVILPPVAPSTPNYPTAEPTEHAMGIDWLGLEPARPNWGLLVRISDWVTGVIVALVMMSIASFGIWAIYHIVRGMLGG